MFSLFFPKTGALYLTFPHPEPEKKRTRLFPVFIPYAGCPQRCLFCAQHLQTGQSVAPLERVLDEAWHTLQTSVAPDNAFELAFFGGTFTALPQAQLTACLDFAARVKAWYPQVTFRCSTRPDALAEPVLEKLQHAGITTIELGIQSFTDAALAGAQRGYTAACARNACAVVREHGFSLGIQLLPGLPQHTPHDFMNDVAQSIALQPDVVRLYPCLVVAGTLLANAWHQQTYVPWPDAVMQTALAAACLQFWQQGIPVIRIGVAQEESFETHVLAGLRHPALGAMVRAEALFLHVQAMVQHMKEAAAARHAGTTADVGATAGVSATAGVNAAADVSATAGANLTADVGAAFAPCAAVPEKEVLRLAAVESALAALPRENALHLMVPQRWSGEFWGHARHIAPQYAALGLGTAQVHFWAHPFFCLALPVPSADPNVFFLTDAAQVASVGNTMLRHF